MATAISSPTHKLRWRLATAQERNENTMIMSGTAYSANCYILEQEFRTQYADEAIELEWRVVEIEKDQ